MTGPKQDNSKEEPLWTLLVWMKPRSFTSPEKIERWGNVIKLGGDQGRYEGLHAENIMCKRIYMFSREGLCFSILFYLSKFLACVRNSHGDVILGTRRLEKSKRIASTAFGVTEGILALERAVNCDAFQFPRKMYWSPRDI